MSTWRVDLYDRVSTIRVSDLRLKSFRISHVLNGPGAFEGEMALTHAQATQTNFYPGKQEIRVYRNNTLVWGGVLWLVQATAETYNLRLSGEGYFSWLRHRNVENDLIYWDIDQGDIAWNLINYTQTNHGTFGFTDGHVDTGVTADRLYCAMGLPNVGDSITELSEMDNSFDFWITPTFSDSTNKIFKTPTPSGGTALRGTDRTGSITFDGSNSLTTEWTIDASSAANRIWGAGAGECNPPTYEASDATSIAAYGELHDILDLPDSDHLKAVEAHTREELRQRKNPQHTATLMLYEAEWSWGSFDVGDKVNLNSTRGYISGNKVMRVVSFEVNVNTSINSIFYNVELDSVVV